MENDKLEKRLLKLIKNIKQFKDHFHSEDIFRS